MNDQTITIIIILITFLVAFLLAYYFAHTISISKNITSNLRKLYTALFMACIMSSFEILVLLIIGKGNLIIVFLGIIFLVAAIFIGYQLKTLRFMNEKQLLLTMIEHSETSKNIVDKLLNKTNDEELNTLLQKIDKDKKDEIEKMYELLKRYKLIF